MHISDMLTLVGKSVFDVLLSAGHTPVIRALHLLLPFLSISVCLQEKEHNAHSFSTSLLFPNSPPQMEYWKNS